MNSMIVNEELTMNVPEGFHIMTEEELAQLKYFDKPMWLITDPDRHIIFTISWRKSGLAALLLKPKEVIKKMEPQLRKVMKPYDYRFQDYLETDMGGQQAEGFLYAYKSKEIDMCGVAFSVKKGKVFYYIYCYMREELLGKSRPVLEEIMQGAIWT